MSRRSLLDDVQVKWTNEDYGPPILFTNAEIRRMLRLVGAGKNDVFYDLGCGWAQNLIIAAAEFGVKKCVGIEVLPWRYRKAKERVERRSLSNHIKIISGYFDDLIEGKFKEARIEYATIILYTLVTSKKVLDLLNGKLREGCRLLYYYRTLFPEIKPDAVDHPFYLSIFPFKTPGSELDWLSSVVRKEKSTVVQSAKPTAEELWDELYHDYNIEGLSRNEVREYQRRLEKFLRVEQ